jgi:hypothetical protein
MDDNFILEVKIKPPCALVVPFKKLNVLKIMIEINEQKNYGGGALMHDPPATLNDA